MEHGYFTDLKFECITAETDVFLEKFDAYSYKISSHQNSSVIMPW